MTRASPRFQARMAGVLYVLEGVAAVSGQLLIPGTLVVLGGPAATAANILASEGLFRLSIAAGFLAVALHTAQTVLFYNLFRPVSRSVVLLFAFFSVLALGIQAASSVFQLPVLTILGGGPGVAAFSVEQAQSLAYVFLGWRAQTFNVYLVFFGFRCAAIAYLIYRSTFLPRPIGVLMGFTAAGYLTLLWPPLADFLSPYNMVLVAPGELSFVAWLLVVGVNNDRWNEQAREAMQGTERVEEGARGIR